MQVVAAKKVRGGQEVTELDSAKTTVDVIPPEPANLSTTLINAASRTITGTGEAGALVSLKKIKLFCQKQLLMIQGNLFFLSQKINFLQEMY